MISNKCYYGLRAMLELTLRQGGGPVTIADIAQSQDIPVRFLEAILRQLKQAGFADSVRGKEGGYFLAKPADKVTLAQLIRLFEGPLVSVNAQAASGGKARSPAEDVFAEVWNQADRALEAVLEKVTLDQLADRQQALSAAHATSYTI